VRIHWQNLRDLPWKKRRRYIKDSFKRLLIKMGQRKAVRDAMPVKKYFPHDHRAATTLAIRNYEPQKMYAGNMTVFKVKEHPWYVRWDRMAGWSRLVAGTITFHEVPGNHGSVMREPNIKYLAEEITKALQFN
jgi:thioesterase domain-containing protein